MYISASHVLHPLRMKVIFLGLWHVLWNMILDKTEQAFLTAELMGGHFCELEFTLADTKMCLPICSWITPGWENSSVCLFTWSRESPGDTEQSMYFSSLGEELLLAHYIRSSQIDNLSK